MDLLASLHLDELPEQQTRTSHLERKLADDPKVRLGFNACCHCASQSVSVECRGCHRVKYCSQDCLKRDASSASVDEEATALGHSSIICALLRLCEADEDTEEAGCSSDQDAAQRVQSERESYPATLSNILLDGPCYQQGGMENKELVIHVIGASEEAELWGRSTQKHNKMEEVWDAYSEALAELAERRKLRKISLFFIGPDCPDNNLFEKRRVSMKEEENGKRNNSSWHFIATTRSGNYSRDMQQVSNEDALPKADVVVFFNPGFTCPDYDWDETLSCIPHGTPFLTTTNTEMEGIADCQHLWERGHIASLPPVVAELIDEADKADPDALMFFGENPFVGTRVRQSGTMANDVFVKNRWMFGGTFSRLKGRVVQGHAITSGKAIAKSADPNRTAKKRKRGRSGNTKKKNPALI